LSTIEDSCAVEKQEVLKEREPKKPILWKRRLGLGLIVLSCLFYGGLFLVPMTALSSKGKIALSSALVISGEASFWIGGLILGKEMVAKYRGVLDPRRWWKGRKIA